MKRNLVSIRFKYEGKISSFHKHAIKATNDKIIFRKQQRNVNSNGLEF